MATISKVFLDAAYAIALSAPNDEHHSKALWLADRLETGNIQLITTRAVMLEIGNSLAKIQHRRAALALLDSLEEDPSVDIVPLSDEIYGRALQIYRDRLDKEWGITDCISFVVMRDHGLTAALTTDEHFEQAGFRAILREDQAHL